MDRVTLCEALPIPTAGAAGVLLGEAVREAGLSPDQYLAVIPAEMGRAGRRNLNGRIYVPEELEAEHARLSAEAQSRFVDGELGHPEAGPTWNVAARFLGGETVRESDGSVTAKGRFGILNTSAGRDVMTLWGAGLPIGSSKRAHGYVNEHKLDESSRFRAMNPGLEGATAKLVTGLRLGTYDVVRISSADTHFAPATAEVREAFARLTEAHILPEVAAIAPDPVEVTAPDEGDKPEGRQMKTIEELRAAYPELVAKLTEEANPFNALPAEQRQLAARLAAALRDKPDVAETDWAKVLQEQVEPTRQRIQTVEEKNAKLDEALAAVKADSQTLREELAWRDTRDSIRGALDAWGAGRVGGKLVVDRVMESVAAKAVKTAESATVQADSLFKLGEDLAALRTVPTPGTPPAPATPTAESTDSSPNPSTRPGGAQPKDPFLALVEGSV